MFFKKNLEMIATAFRHEITFNEATTRNYINPFMVEAVSAVREHHNFMHLVAKEQFDGSKGYGQLDYAILCNELVVIVTEAKTIEMQKGIAQNLAQLHSAVEVLQNFFL